MNVGSIVVAALLLGDCSGRAVGEHDALMSRLEADLQLPQGASALSQYSRYYADAGDGMIVAVYLIPFDQEVTPADDCEELLAGFSTREVPCPDLQTPWAVPAGERRWLDDRRDLPWINDGGCAQINLAFDKASAAVKRIECNGEA